MRESTETMAAAVSYGRRLSRRLALMTVIVAALTVLGPFGTFGELPPLTRLGYWGVTIGAGFAVFEALLRLAEMTAGRERLARPPLLAGLTLAACLLLTVIVAAVEWTVRQRDFFSPAGFAELFVYVGTLTVMVAALPLWLELRRPPGEAAVTPAAAVPPEPEPESESEPEPPFLDRIPARLGRQVTSLHMEDHYVRVRTPLGSDLVLLRMRDAVAELAGYPGLQVHRSHWVATAAVQTADRTRDGRITLVLHDGTRVPVSRTYAAAVRAAGW